jgi:Site-specific DNA methylase
LPTIQMFEPRLDQKAGTLTTVTKDNLVCEPLKIREATKAGYTEIKAGDCVDMAQPNSKTRRGRNMESKSNCLQTTNEFYQYCGSIDAPIYEVKDGYITVKGNKYPITLIDGFYIIRKLTVRECMRLQTVPEWYEWPVSKSQAYKMLGNGWTVEVIAHLLRGLK